MPNDPRAIARLTQIEAPGQPAWDNTDYGRDFMWLGQPRWPLPTPETYRTPARIRADARAAGLILCDCVWVETDDRGPRLVIWVPWCQAHGGGCNRCGHRHLNLDGAHAV